MVMCELRTTISFLDVILIDAQILDCRAGEHNK